MTKLPKLTLLSVFTEDLYPFLKAPAASGGKSIKNNKEMQNKPNLRTTQMNLNFYPTTPYENKPLCSYPQNKPNQTQFKANFNLSATHQSQNKPNPNPIFTRHSRANPISVPQNSPMVYNAAEIYKELRNEH